MERSAGILMPIFSLPSPYGIGTLGREAYAFVDFLAAAGQKYWQILPVGPTSFGDSPYQSPSAYAGNPYFIDLHLLIEEGLLTKAEVESFFWGSDPSQVDYHAMYQNRLELLRIAAERGYEQAPVADFERENSSWLPDYALFMAIKRYFKDVSWLDWSEEALRRRDAEALAEYREKLKEDIRLFTFVQYLFFRQWKSLREYAHEKGVMLIGDLPIYVALDSADVWARPENFQLDENYMPVEVSGVPPDMFSADGQLWGNPLYDYEKMAEKDYEWWVKRIEGASRLYDVIRIDHFRGFESYWAVPYGETTAKSGRWRKGPGMALVGLLKEKFPKLSFIAEDLGYPSPEVRALLADSGFPGMKVLVFSFDTKDSDISKPHDYIANSVCYAGTHDNDTLKGWLEHADSKDRKQAALYFGLNRHEGYVRGMLRGGMASVPKLFIAQMQDYLKLGSEARMNTPGKLEGNWRWRLLPGQANERLAGRIRVMTERYGRGG
ncbi:MAG: 4-alpha-glucanotransferase [Lachnospiraceae bacterium]|nr:4-alpha-glucanotransferase [Lachnospiraceae bacterium]